MWVSVWVKGPLLDSRFNNWPSGDTYIVYPDARSSIRFERLREGIQDAEKIRLLRDEFRNNSSNEAKDKLRRLDDALTSLNIAEKSDNFNELLKEAKQILESLSE